MLCFILEFTYIIRFNYVKFINLEKTFNNSGHLKYDYKGRFILLWIYLGRYVKLKSCRDLNSNFVSLLNVNQYFSIKKFYSFKNLKIYKGRYVDLIEVMADINFLQGSYQKIISKVSNNETFYSLNYNSFKKISYKLFNGSLSFMLVQRSIILKSVVNNVIDMVIQQAMVNILKHIFKPFFFNILYDCTCKLEVVKMNWVGITWLVKFNSCECFNIINRHRLVSILNEKIDDITFIDLIFKLFNSGVIG